MAVGRFHLACTVFVANQKRLRERIMKSLVLRYFTSRQRTTGIELNLTNYQRTVDEDRFSRRDMSAKHWESPTNVESVDLAT